MYSKNILRSINSKIPISGQRLYLSMINFLWQLVGVILYNPDLRARLRYVNPASQSWVYPTCQFHYILILLIDRSHMPGGHLPTLSQSLSSQPFTTFRNFSSYEWSLVNPLLYLSTAQTFMIILHKKMKPSWVTHKIILLDQHLFDVTISMLISTSFTWMSLSMVSIFISSKVHLAIVMHAK